MSEYVDVLDVISEKDYNFLSSEGLFVCSGTLDTDAVDVLHSDKEKSALCHCG